MDSYGKTSSSKVGPLEFLSFYEVIQCQLCCFPGQLNVTDFNVDQSYSIWWESINVFTKRYYNRVSDYVMGHE